LYARYQSHGELVGKIIYEQYSPRNMDDTIPSTIEGSIYGIADRMDTIASMFKIGLDPTSSKDPHGLRRAGNGVIKILAETNIPMTFEFVIGMSCTMSGAFTDDGERVKAFMLERLEFYLREICGYTYDSVKAVLGAKRSIGGLTSDVLGALLKMSEVEWTVPDIVARAKALSDMRDSEDFLAVCTTFKRMKNIILQAHAQGDRISAEIRTGHFQSTAESELESKAGLVREKVDAFRANRQYVPALQAIATLRPYLDAFFDAVMVLAPEDDLRANRLALLTRLLGDFMGIADFSEIAKYTIGITRLA